MDASSASGSMSVSSMCSHQDARKSSACGRPRTTSSRRMPRPVVRWSAPRGSPWVRSLASWSRVLQLRQSLLFLMMWSMTSRVVTREERLYLDQFKRPSINAYLNLFWYWLVLFLFAGVMNLCGYYWLTLKILLWLIASGYHQLPWLHRLYFLYSLHICMISNARLCIVLQSMLLASYRVTG